MSGLHVHGENGSLCSKDLFFPSSHENRMRSNRRLFIAMLINIVIPVVQIVGGIYANSMAIISDATHNFSDFAALFIAYIAVRISSKKPTPSHTYGFGKAEVVAAFVNVFLLTGASAIILKEAIERFISGGVVLGPWVIGLASIGIIGNGFSAWLLHGDSRHNINLRGAFLHMVADFLTSVAVFVVGCLLLFKPWYWLDPLVSLAIVIFILKNCWSIFREALKILMDATPANLCIESVRNAIKELPGVIDVHHMHAWSINPTSIGFSCHIVVPNIPIGDLHELTNKIKKLLMDKFSIDHPVIQFETVGCEENGLLCGESPYLYGHDTPTELERDQPHSDSRIRSVSWQDMVVVALRLLFGGVFVYASIGKMLHPKEFAEVIFNYSILPLPLINFVAVVLPWLECIAGLAVIFGKGIRGGIAILNILLIVFIIALIANIVRGIDISCGCFEASLSASTRIDMWFDVFRDLVLLATGVFLWIKVYRKDISHRDG